MNSGVSVACAVKIYWGVAKPLWQGENVVDVLGGMIYLFSGANGEFYVGNGDVSQKQSNICANERRLDIIDDAGIVTANIVE